MINNLSSWGYKEALTLLISLAAVVISLSTYYYNVIKKASIRILIGDLLTFDYTTGGKLKLTLNLTCFNLGARPGALIKITGRILDLHEKRESLINWLAFIESKDIGEKGKNFKPWIDFSGWVTPLVVLPQSAIVKGIAFVSEKKFVLKEGSYKVELWGEEGFNRRVIPQATCVIHISHEDERYLSEKCIATTEGITNNMLFKVLKGGSQS